MLEIVHYQLNIGIDPRLLKCQYQGFTLIFTFTGIEKDPTTGNIIKFSSGKYLESGFTNESTDATNQMPTVGVVTLEKV